MVLAHVIAKLYGAGRLVLGHVDHGVRAGSAEDRERVEAFARHLGARSLSTTLPPGSDAEARLRALRYRALEAQRQAAGAELILTAHTQDDAAETVLITFLRNGIPRGIPEQRGRVVRPLLGVPRAAVRAHAARHHLEHAEDPSNREPRYLRNRVRKELLPLLESRYRPGVGRRLAALPRTLFSQPRVVRGGTDGREGTGRKAPARALENATRPEATEIVGWLEGETSIGLERRPWGGGAFPDGRRIAVFDADLLDRPALRLARPGDRIRPFGMTGRKKLTDVLREAGVPAALRARVPVVAGPGDQVVWVPGLLRGAEAPVGETTREVWLFTFKRDSRVAG